MKSLHTRGNRFVLSIAGTLMLSGLGAFLAIPVGVLSVCPRNLGRQPFQTFNSKS